MIEYRLDALFKYNVKYMKSCKMNTLKNSCSGTFEKSFTRGTNKEETRIMII